MESDPNELVTLRKPATAFNTFKSDLQARPRLCG